MSENKDDPSKTEPTPAEKSDFPPPDPSPKSSAEKLPETSDLSPLDPSPKSSAEKLPETSDLSPPDPSPKSSIEEPLQDTSEQDEENETEETYTFDEAIDLAGYGKFQKFVTFLAGLGWLADAFEVIILSIIGDMIACTWPMKRWQNALMTSIVFAGMTTGAPIFGVMADRFGRKLVVAVSMILLFIFGAASAAAPNYTWMVVLRGFMGFAIGGMAQGVTLSCEYYPAKMRGRAGFYLSYYWSVGSIGVVCAAWIIMRFTDNWRIFVFVASIPALIVFLSMKWYPESVRYYIVSNQTEKAVKTLERLARMNNAKLPKGKLVEMEASEERGKLMDLLKPGMRKRTLLFWYIWLAIACAYYGIALMTPQIITNDSLIDAAKKHENTSITEDFNYQMPCVRYTDRHFVELLWTTAAEFPGLLIFTFTVENCSRRIYLGSTCLLLGFLILFIMLKMEPKVAMLIILFVCRGLVAAVFQLLFIMTTEAFPTTLRASAMGTGSAMARFGGLLVPYLAQVAVLAKPIPSIFVLGFVTAMAGVAAFLLPVDTRGRNMEDIIEQLRASEEQINIRSKSEA